MRIAYFDCFAGAAGNMILGSLLDAGLSADVLRSELAKLHLSHYEIRVEKTIRKGIEGTLAVVSVEQGQSFEHRNLNDIEEIIENSDLDPEVKPTSRKIFQRLAQAEATVHSVSIQEIHFHEVGAMDAIIDIVGSVVGLKTMGIERVYSSPLHLGSGLVECTHGTLPVPAPATAELIKGKPVYSTGIQGELLTPTGAAILTTIASGFCPIPKMIVEKIGYGAGTMDVPIPNFLRVLIGDEPGSIDGYLVERVTVLETNIDDMNPQIYDYLIEKLLGMGVLDVFLSSVQMKKNRPGTLLTIICLPDMKDTIAEFLMNETTTIGLRWREDNRVKAYRSIKEFQTQYGPVKFKIAQLEGNVINVSPEYEDCKRISLEKRIPLKLVIQEAGLTANKIRGTQ